MEHGVLLLVVDKNVIPGTLAIKHQGSRLMSEAK